MFIFKCDVCLVILVLILVHDVLNLARTQDLGYPRSDRHTCLNRHRELDLVKDISGVIIIFQNL